MRFLTIFMFILCFAYPVKAQEVQPDYNSFGAWPVLNEGRVKTMDSFARSVFFDISGQTAVRGITAMEWLTHSLFDPSSMIPEPFIKVSSKSILDLPQRDGSLYSLAEVMTALNPHEDMILALEQKDPAEYSASQRDLMQVYNAVSLYNQIIQALSAILPLQGAADKTYFGGQGDRVQREMIASGGVNNRLLKIVPTDNPSMPYISVWQAVNNNVGETIVTDLQNMAAAWVGENYETWNAIAADVKNELQVEADQSVSLQLEAYYISIQPILWVIGFYIFSLILFFAVKPLSILAVITGFFIHLSALMTRGIILARPPTGTLYETLLFGSAVIVGVGLLVWFFRRDKALFPIICAASAAFLLFVSRGFIQGDSLNVLAAVLNTNFWLSTHVTCIIIGYGFCIMAAVVAHIVLAFENTKMKSLLMPLALAALLFTSVGTLLGGIWADQSWGRFWGWDPKENGALLIVLWLAWVLHGRVSGHFKAKGFAAAMALTNIMVALTWFGVNLLGVGLHSYGFISGVAWGLGSFIVLQSAVVAGLYYFPKIRGRNA